MPRRPSPDRTIGERINDRRKLLGYSIRFAADRAGMSHTTWSRIEQGKVSADNRFTLASIAEALRCSVVDLAGNQEPPATRSQAEMHAAVTETLRAVTESDLDYPATVSDFPSLQILQRELDLISLFRTKCEYESIAQRLPGLIRGLHAAVQGSDGDDRTEALRALVRTHDLTSFVVRYLGQPMSATFVAERARQAAQELEDPVMLGLSAWSMAHGATGVGLYAHALHIAERATADLAGHINLPDAREMLGQLHLMCGFALYGLGRLDESAARIAEADRIAQDTGDSEALKLAFGPTNVRLWRVSMFADGDDPGRAIEIAASTNQKAIPTVSRRANFMIDTARALSNVTGRDQEALRSLLAAERLAPQRTYALPQVTETARILLHRARKGTGWTELRGLCERLGVQL